jgi:hypothetical protein
MGPDSESGSTKSLNPDPIRIRQSTPTIFEFKSYALDFVIIKLVREPDAEHEFASNLVAN